MNKILEKFIKKIEKIQNYGIIYQDEEQVLISIPLEIDINVSYVNRMSCNTKDFPEKRDIVTLCLCTATKTTPMKKICDKKNIRTIEITSKSADKTPEEIEEFYNGAMIHFYNLYTKLGDGHQ